MKQTNHEASGLYSRLRLLTAVVTLALLGAMTATAANEKKLHLGGKVKESLGQTDLLNAYVLLLDDDGNPTDTIRANQGRTYRNGEVTTTSWYSFEVPRVDSTYVFRVECERYAPRTVSFTVEKIGKRETSRQLPDIYLDRAPVQLKEVTVTTSKIKFYNKGDTLVYNADAFQLAEGSMLDALISQLPGVELSDDGQIKVNGQFVESLLLNGKEFFDGDNNLMLENIAAYTVKNIQVYEGQSQQAKRELRTDAPKVLTMDVKLKKEYDGGFIVNAQGGYGTEDRYMGRLFASWFRNRTKVAIIANANNLNDNRKPGRNDSWTPEQMPNGIRKIYTAGIDYSHETGDEKFETSGSVTVRHSNNYNKLTNNRINFLPGGDTYENSFADARNKHTSVKFHNSIYTDGEKFNFSNYIAGEYHDRRNSSAQLGGAFSEEQPGMTADILDAIYSDGTPEQLESIINRSKTTIDGRTKELYGVIGQGANYKIPRTNDVLRLYIDASYRSKKNYEWRDYDINFGRNTSSAEHRRQYTDNTPNHELHLNGQLGYYTYVNGFSLGITYGYEFEDKVSDTYMYALERLNNMGIYGVLPEGYESTFMPGWSNTSRTLTNYHSLMPSLTYWKIFGKSTFSAVLYPHLDLTHRHFDYHRDGRDYPLSTTNVTLNVSPQYAGRIDFQFQPKGEPDPRGYYYDYRNSLTFQFGSTPRLPDLIDMVDVVNDADPLNIYRGNRDLKPEITYTYQLTWKWCPASYALNNTLLAHYSYKVNALTQGYTYDTSTGIRYNRTYNVDGNWSAQLHNNLSYQFGSTKQFSLSSGTMLNLAGYSDMIGINTEEPELLKVHFNSISEDVRLGWQIGSQQITLRCDFTSRHTTSAQPGFNDITATHVNYGVSGSFKLPAGFGISTDFMCYTRRGYGTKALDTTDPVWNMRLTYAPKGHNRWVFMADAFDLLHKLSNVNYAVTASGRTVSYTNALPRYVLISAQYRFSIQPPKR